MYNDAVLTAHRGNLIQAENPKIENTVEAIKNAIECEEIGAIEFDIQMTKDKKFILMNYIDPSRVLLGFESGKRVCDYTYEELMKMPLKPNEDILNGIINSNAVAYGSAGEEALEYAKAMFSVRSKISTLDEVMALDRNGKTLFVEIKDVDLETDDKVEEYVLRLMSVCFKYDMSNVKFISRSKPALRRLKRFNYNFHCSPVLTDVNDIDTEFDGLSIPWSILDKVVPGTNLEVWEYIKVNNLGAAVWNLATLPEYTRALLLINNYSGVYATGDAATLYDTFNNDLGVEKKVRIK